jgi:hypothetical protein
MTRLDEFDMVEWWDVARRLDPTMSWEEFEADWQEFARLQMHNVRVAIDRPPQPPPTPWSWDGKPQVGANRPPPMPPTPWSWDGKPQW